MRKKLDIVRIVKGNSATIRAFGSDVVLRTPKNLYAVILGNIHVNHAPFQHLVPANECIVGPICEYSVHPLINSPTRSSELMYQLQIPHIIKDIETVKHCIRVRPGNLRSQVQGLKLACEPMESRNAKVWYEVGKHFITVHTSHFSGCIVTLDGINCCSGSANVLLFGCLSNTSTDDPLATMKVYMSSAHSIHIRDYGRVS